MKRGKRQVVTNNIFNEDQDSASNEGGPDFYNNLKQNEQKPPIQKSQQISKQANLNKTLPQVEKGPENQTGTDERKKRLELLKKKYLKGNKESQTKQIKEQPKEEEKKIPFKKKEPEKVKQTFVKELKPQKIEIIEERVETQEVREENSNDMEEAIQKQQKEQVVEEKKVIPVPSRRIPPPVGAKKRKVVPPPQTFFNRQEQTEPLPQKIAKDQIKQEKPSSKPVPKRIVPQITEENNIEVDTKNSDDIFDDILSYWLGENPYNSQSISKSFVIQKEIKLNFSLKQNNSYTHLLKRMIQEYIIYSKESQEQTQFQLIQNILIEEEQLKNTIQEDYVLILLIKGGKYMLEKYSKLLVGNASENIKKLIKYKAYINEEEFETFVNFIFQHCEVDLSKLIQLLKINFRSKAVTKRIMSIQKQTGPCNELGEILCLLYLNINEINYPAYFHILQIVVSYVSSEQKLEKMISKSASISLQQAYNLKKESRMKIIQKMESLKDKNSQLPTTKGNGEDAIQKTVGFFKKLINQVSEKEKQPVEEPKQQIYYDKQKGRFVLNGKIPDTDEPEPSRDKPKVPPPPPSSRMKNSNPPATKKRAVIRQANIDFDD